MGMVLQLMSLSYEVWERPSGKHHGPLQRLDHPDLVLLSDLKKEFNQEAE